MTPSRPARRLWLCPAGMCGQSQPAFSEARSSCWSIPAGSPCHVITARCSCINSISLSFLVVHKITGRRPTVVVLGAVEHVIAAWGGTQQTSETSRLVLREMRCLADITCFLTADPGGGTMPLGPGRSLSLLAHAAPSPCFPTPTPTAVPPGNSYLPPQLRVSPRIFLLRTRAVTGAGGRHSASG